MARSVASKAVILSLPKNLRGGGARDKRRPVRGRAFCGQRRCGAREERCTLRTSSAHRSQRSFGKLGMTFFGFGAARQCNPHRLSKLTSGTPSK